MIHVHGRTHVRGRDPGWGWLVVAADAGGWWRCVGWLVDYEQAHEFARWLGQLDACTTVIINLADWEPGAWEIVVLHERDRNQRSR